MHKFWTKDDVLRIKTAATFEELCVVAFEIIKRMPRPVGMVSGPITSGGEGSIKKNIAVFSKTIQSLSPKGKSIFNQLPFEGSMRRIIKTPYYKGNNHLLETFYLPLFKSKSIKIVYFMSTWKTSYGARWEHDQALALKMKIVYLS